MKTVLMVSLAIVFYPIHLYLQYKRNLGVMREMERFQNALMNWTPSIGVSIEKK